MKTNSIKHILIAGLLCCGLSTTFTSCSDILDEQPRSQFDPSFFTTKKGIEGGLTSLYAHLRYFYGNGYWLNICETGTDEYTYAQSADGNFKDADLSGVGKLTSSSSRSDLLWGTAFANINTASGIIENGAAAGISDVRLLPARADFRRRATRPGCRRPEVQHLNRAYFQAQHCARGLRCHLQGLGESRKRPARDTTSHRRCNEKRSTPVPRKGLSDIRMVAGKSKRNPNLS